MLAEVRCYVDALGGASSRERIGGEPRDALSRPA
jgi:hypothetical protein